MSDDKQSFTDYMSNLKTKRIWYKPWTWRRRSIWDAYYPMQEQMGNVAHAVNPMLGEAVGRELEMPLHIFEPDEPITWDDESETQ